MATKYAGAGSIETLNASFTLINSSLTILTAVLSILASRRTHFSHWRFR